MPAPGIRGHQGRIKLFRNGQEAGIINVTAAEVSQDSSFSRAFYVGSPIGVGDQTVEGWSGSMDLEVTDSSVDDLIDALIAGNLAGIGVDEMTCVLDEYYPDGQIAAYVYYGGQFKMSKRVGGLTEKQTKKLDFQFSGRTRL